EDITTVVPLERDEDQAVQSVVVVSMPIEDLRTLVAHAAGYTAKYSLGSMVGEGTTFASVRGKAARVAKNKHHVLIQGEAGTGKQRMAHGIHQASNRAAGPLITLRCGDTTQELLEQELFGVVLNAEVSHQGRLELASGGTLFLDEIEKMPKPIAKSLARALATGKACRVGETVERHIDVRIIAACDSDLKRLTERGLFDGELYEALSKSVIRVPALRSRREDIPKLAAHIVSELAEQHQMAPKKILPETEKVLREYDWPGNIKQLQSVLEYAFFNTNDDVINPHDISLMGDVKPDNKWKEDKDVFVKAWQAAGGNVSRLANLLNVSRVTLYRYLKKYGLEKK
ncbi:MAG: sigma-54-dependent Fis family transcriptional regulator, partial [Selenomonas sp.]|nr:sigma-54-dependent Fis family transcriptional regulator [Selenomonas sp.]